MRKRIKSAVSRPFVALVLFLAALWRVDAFPDQGKWDFQLTQVRKRVF